MVIVARLPAGVLGDHVWDVDLILLPRIIWLLIEYGRIDFQYDEVNRSVVSETAP